MKLFDLVWAGLLVAAAVLFGLSLLPKEEALTAVKPRTTAQNPAEVRPAPESSWPEWLGMFVAPAKLGPLATPAPAPAPVENWDRNSVKYIGSVLDNGIRRYYFKSNNEAKLLKIAENEAVDGWKILEVQARYIRLSGPGGRYEVGR